MHFNQNETTKLKGENVSLGGVGVNLGENAPRVNVVSKNLNTIEIGGNKNKIQVIVSVPSLDTPVCASQTRRFNEEIAKYDNIILTVISMDLPFAMDRFCATEGIENLTVGSDFRQKEFSNAYGVLITDGPLEGVAARAVFIVDQNGVITYKELCPEITEEPNYNRIKQAINDLL